LLIGIKTHTWKENHGNYTTNCLSRYFYISCVVPMMKNAIYVTISAPRKCKQGIAFIPEQESSYLQVAL